MRGGVAVFVLIYIVAKGPFQIFLILWEMVISRSRAEIEASPDVTPAFEVRDTQRGSEREKERERERERERENLQQSLTHLF